MTHQIELEFDHVITKTIHETGDEIDKTFYVHANVSFTYDKDDGASVDVDWTIAKSVHDKDFSELLRFLDPESHEELEDLIQEKAEEKVIEAIEEWQREGYRI